MNTNILVDINDKVAVSILVEDNGDWYMRNFKEWLYVDDSYLYSLPGDILHWGHCRR